jgi:adenylylsulfate kinase
MKGVVAWFFGLPASGKTTIAHAVQSSLRSHEAPCCLLDGDEVRSCLVPAPGYDAAGRDAFYETLSRLAGALARQKLIVLVAATAHKRAYRERARALAPWLLEVFVDTPLAECERRDPKGHYQQARQGRIANFPGVNEPFEEPGREAIRASGAGDERVIAAIVERLLSAEPDG